MNLMMLGYVAKTVIGLRSLVKKALEQRLSDTSFLASHEHTVCLPKASCSSHETLWGFKFENGRMCFPFYSPIMWVLFDWMGTVGFKTTMAAWGDLCRRWKFCMLFEENWRPPFPHSPSQELHAGQPLAFAQVLFFCHWSAQDYWAWMEPLSSKSVNCSHDFKCASQLHHYFVC